MPYGLSISLASFKLDYHYIFSHFILFVYPKSVRDYKHYAGCVSDFEHRPSTPTSPAKVQHGPWMRQQRKRQAKPRSRTSPPPPLQAFEISTENRFAPLRETERDTVILGDSIVRHVRATGAKGKVHTRCFPGARVLDVAAQVPAILKEIFGAVVLHAGTNYTRLRQTEILKRDFRILVETHVDFATRGANTLDLVYTNIPGAYRAEPRPPLGYSDHCSVMLIPAYRPLVRRSKPVLKQVKTWPEGATSALQDCFECTDWDMFREAATYGDSINLEEYTSSVTCYISKEAKRAHAKKIHSHFQDSGDTRRMWQGIQAITNYKTTSPACDRDAYLPDALNDFHGLFEVQNNVVARKTIPPHTDQVLCQTTAEVRKTLCRVNPRKSAGPDNIPGRVRTECAEQLADVFTDIFNISLSSNVVPTCLKTTTIVPVPKKLTVSCLNDYHPVALTRIVMKCFERLVMRHIKTQLPPSLDPMQFAYRPNRSTDDAISTTLHLAYAKFAGAPLKVHKISNPWRSPTGALQSSCSDPFSPRTDFK
ncbi:hypothetical protein C0J45_17251 [Silurus meridionalis]|nr:hypothetical protein C0J45_17251 [Silurus meridionalis]